MSDCNNCKNARWNDRDAQGRIKCSGTGRGYVDPADHDSFCRCGDYDYSGGYNPHVGHLHSRHSHHTRLCALRTQHFYGQIKQQHL